MFVISTIAMLMADSMFIRELYSYKLMTRSDGVCDIPPLSLLVTSHPPTTELLPEMTELDGGVRKEKIH